MSTDRILEIRDLSVEFDTDTGLVKAVNKLNLSLDRGKASAPTPAHARLLDNLYGLFLSKGILTVDVEFPAGTAFSPGNTDPLTPFLNPETRLESTFQPLP